MTLPDPPVPFPDDVPTTPVARIPLWRVWHPTADTASATQMRHFGPLHRFDPHPAGPAAEHPQHVVWYGAQQFEVALLEVHNRDTPAAALLGVTPPVSICRSVRASLVTVVRDPCVFDLTNPDHRDALGAPAELGTAVTADYRVQQGWSRQLRAARGVDGIRYPSARSTHVNGVACALLRSKIGTVTAQHLLIDDTLWPLVVMALDSAGLAWQVVDRCPRC